MHTVALDNLTHVHELTEQAGRAGWRAAQDDITGFGGSQVMADRANAADTGCYLRHFDDKATFAEFLEASEFIYMKVSVLNGAIFFHVDGHFCVTFNPGNWFDSNFLCTHSFLLMPVVEFAFDFGHSALG
jgi:hypothetical protein